jgi:hypothetical protein
MVKHPEELGFKLGLKIRLSPESPMRSKSHRHDRFVHGLSSVFPSSLR